MSRVPDGWRECTIGDVVSEIDAGTSVNSQDKTCSDGEKGVLKTSCVSLGYFCPDEHKVVAEDEVDRLRIPVQGDRIILSRMNTPELVGANGYVPSGIPNLFLPDRLWQINSDRSVCSTKWLAQYLASPVGRGVLSACATGTSGSMKNISKAKFKEIIFFLPPLPEQKKIAAILSSVDEAIAATQAVIEQTRKVKQGLLQDLLTRGIGHTRFKQTEIGEIPEEWEVKRLGEVASISSGGTPDRGNQNYWGGDIPWATTSEINFCQIDSTKECISDLGMKNSAAKLYPAGTILIAMYGQGKTRGKVARLGIASATNQACAAVQAQTFYDSEYIYQVLCGSYDALRSLSNDGSQKNLSLGIIKNIIIPVPSHHEQVQIGTILRFFDKALDREATKLSALMQTKRGLMQDLLSGSVRVTTP